MANTTYVPVDYILQRGQTIRCYSLLVNAMHKRRMLCPDDWRVSDGETEADAAMRARDDKDGDKAEDDKKATKKGYVGAVVLTPERGAYFQPVAVLDFSALVPFFHTLNHLISSSSCTCSSLFAHRSSLFERRLCLAIAPLC